MHHLSPAYCDLMSYAPKRASTLLKNYGNLLTWNGKEEVIADIGCANGAITTDILLPFCESNVAEVIGIDISGDMLKLANQINTKPNVSFFEMDVAKKDIDCNLIGKFDHIFSFCSIHMIADQKQLAENLFKVLKPKGELFITFLSKHSLVEVWFIISDHRKWSKYLTNFKNQFSTLMTSEHPMEDCERVFTEAGFSVQAFDIEAQKYPMDQKKLEASVNHLNMPLDYIPKDLRDDFIKDSLELATKLTKKGDSYETSFKEFVVIARKAFD